MSPDYGGDYVPLKGKAKRRREELKAQPGGRVAHGGRSALTTGESEWKT